MPSNRTAPDAPINSASHTMWTRRAWQIFFDLESRGVRDLRVADTAVVGTAHDGTTVAVVIASSQSGETA